VVSLDAITLLDVQRHLTGLQEIMRPVSFHQHYRTLAAFFRWCIYAGLLTDPPMRGLTMRVPRTLPTVPEDEHVRRLLAACPRTFMNLLRFFAFVCGTFIQG
jgi:site-specific recombinase XerD